MTFVTLRDLDTDDTVLGQDWQDLRVNFEYLKSPPLIFANSPTLYLLSGESWQDTDPTNLKFILSTDGGPVFVSFGCFVNGNYSVNTLRLRVLIGGVDPFVYGRSSVYSDTEHENVGLAFPWLLAAGDHEFSFQHHVTDGTARIWYPYITAREF